MTVAGKIGRSLILVGALCVLLLGVWGNGSVAQAQSTVAVQTMTVSLLPQYDDPRLLIIFEADLAEPGQGYIAIPDAVELQGAEARQDDGSYQSIEARFEGASDGRFITFTSPTRSVRLAFYQDVITRDSAHVLDFTLPSQRDALTTLKWRVVFPLGSSDISSEPAMTSIGDVHYGMPGFERDAGALAARTPAVQQVRWSRASNSPSFAREVPTTNATGSETESADTDLENEATSTRSSVTANVGTDILAETTGRIVRGETDLARATEAAQSRTQESDWFTTFRSNPIVWGALAVFVLGLLLVLDGIRKRVKRKPQ